MKSAVETFPVLVEAVPAWVAPIRAEVPSHSSNVHAGCPASDWCSVTVTVIWLMVSPGAGPVTENPDSSSGGESAAGAV